jgi:peptidoglycan/LPS O-acetylase OafA/YrhL
MQLATRKKASVVPVVALMTGVVAVSLAVASTLHLSGSVSGRAKPFNPDAAGIAEAVIGLVLAVAAVALWRLRERARALGLSALGFAIAGFCLGLSITSRSGHWPDIAYHAGVLPVLAVAFVALLRAPDASARQRREARRSPDERGAWRDVYASGDRIGLGTQARGQRDDA